MCYNKKREGNNYHIVSSSNILRSNSIYSLLVLYHTFVGMSRGILKFPILYNELL